MTRYPANVARMFTPPRDDSEEARLATEREMFLRAIGHDLRSPLTAISLGIDLVQRDSSSKERILALMKSTVGRMDRLIEELLSFARNGERS